MASDAPTDTPSSEGGQFRPLGPDKLRAIFEALLVPDRGAAAIAGDVGVSKSTVQKYRDAWLDSGDLVRLRDGGWAANPDQPNPFGVTGPPVDPESIVRADESDDVDAADGGSGDDVAEQRPEPAASAADGAAVVEAEGGGDSPPDPAPEPAGGGVDGENGGDDGGRDGSDGDDTEWPLPDERPPAPATVDGAAPAPAAAGVIDPTVVEVQIQLPVTLLAAWNLMRLDGLELPLNDWIVHTIELHYADCVGVLVALVTTASDDGTPAAATPAA